METSAKSSRQEKPMPAIVAPVALGAARHDDDDECGCERLDNGECGCISDRIARGEVPG